MNVWIIFGLQVIVSICTVFIVEKLIDVWKGRREKSVANSPPPPLGIEEAENLHSYWAENAFKGINFANLRHRSISYPVQFPPPYPNCRYSTEEKE